MSSSSIPPDLAYYVAQIEQQCKSLEPAAKLDFVEKEIRETCEELGSTSLLLNALVELVSTKKLYHQSHATHCAWIESLGLRS